MFCRSQKRAMADEIPNTNGQAQHAILSVSTSADGVMSLELDDSLSPCFLCTWFFCCPCCCPCIGLAMIGSFYRHYRFQVREGQVRYTVLSLQRYDCCGCNAREQPKQIGPHVTVSFARCCLDPDVSGLCCYWTEWRQRRLVPARVLGQRFVSAELNLRLAEQRPVLVLGRLELAH